MTKFWNLIFMSLLCDNWGKMSLFDNWLLLSYLLFFINVCQAKYFADEVNDKNGQDIGVYTWEKEFVKDLPVQKNGFVLWSANHSIGSFSLLNFPPDFQNRRCMQWSVGLYTFFKIRNPQVCRLSQINSLIGFCEQTTLSI